MVTSSVDRSFGARRRALFGILMCLALFLLFAVGYSGSEASASGTSQEEKPESPADQPNIIFVLTDDLDYASIEQMPEISSLLSEEGLTFEQAFVSHPVCCPSRATILTGLYDHNHNVISNDYDSGGASRSSSKRGTRRTLSPLASKREAIGQDSSVST